MYKPIITIVIPCYNEEEVLPISIPKILGIIDSLIQAEKISSQSFIMCCNDGSRDRTWEVISELHQQDERVKGISLAHNRGHQYVLLAGLMSVKDKVDAAISIDADLQDDPNAIVDMVYDFLEGNDIVYGVRSTRASDSWFKRTSAHAFYSFQKCMGVNTVYDHADYRLLSKKALEFLSEYGERNVFLRGIVPMIGLKSSRVYYSRSVRAAGESKYPLKKMIAFSVDGITSFSTLPMKLLFYLGMIMLAIDVIMTSYVFISYLMGRVIAGWTSLMLSVWFIGSLILIGLGVVGVYIGKIYVEVKQRPRYAIEKRID